MRPIILILLAFLALAGCVQHNSPAPKPLAIVFDASGPDFLLAFSANQQKAEARYHAHEFSRLCARIAETLEHDGRLSKPRITSGARMAIYRNDLREFTTLGGSYAAKYPDLKAPVDSYLDKAAGDSAKDMDSSQRERWVKSYRVMANNAQFAAENLK
jgi:nitrous oxide reductase accessory protein NosL